jgi:D-threonate/D-erythronate kinase
MLQVAVIADDLTGAADAGVQFCRAVGPVTLAASDSAELWKNGCLTAGLAAFTNTRNAAAAEACEVLGVAAGKIRALGPRTVYKKIDSCLRGNVGAEMDALLPALGCTASFVAPAFPQHGRITIDDLHLVNGVPVAETEFGRDLLSPVRESRLSVLLSGQSRLPVGHVNLACMEKGPEAVTEAIRSLLHSGCRHIAFDAVRPAHLDTVAGLARDSFAGILLVGSAGLAASQARSMKVEPVAVAALSRPRLKRPLLVCGSSSGVLAEQRDMLVQQADFAQAVLDPAILGLPDAGGRRNLAEGLAGTWQKGGLILSVAPLPPTGPFAMPDRVVRGLAEVTDALIRHSSPDGLFLSGGDTAEAVWRQTGAEAILLIEEVLPGLMRGQFIGGRLNGLPVVTKAGTFGGPQTLVQLFRLLS